MLRNHVLGADVLCLKTMSQPTNNDANQELLANLQVSSRVARRQQRPILSVPTKTNPPLPTHREANKYCVFKNFHAPGLVLAVWMEGLVLLQGHRPMRAPTVTSL